MEPVDVPLGVTGEADQGDSSFHGTLGRLDCLVEQGRADAVATPLGPHDEVLDVEVGTTATQLPHHPRHHLGSDLLVELIHGQRAQLDHPYGHRLARRHHEGHEGPNAAHAKSLDGLALGAPLGPELLDHPPATPGTDLVRRLAEEVTLASAAAPLLAPRRTAAPLDDHLRQTRHQTLDPLAEPGDVHALLHSFPRYRGYSHPCLRYSLSQFLYQNEAMLA